MVESELKNLTIDILTEDDRWNSLEFNISETIDKSIRLVLENEKWFIKHIKDKDIEVSVVLTNDKFIQKLNREYRGADKPTNVLSFPMIEDFNKFVESGVNTEEILDIVTLGDIILSYDTILDESNNQKKSFENHLVHLVIHSTLHLLGYTHERSETADEMEKKEITLLSKIKIHNPYI
jgi:probable rRNA maturation factor